MSSPSVENNDNYRLLQSAPIDDPKKGTSVQGDVEKKLESDYTSALTEVTKMLEMSFDKVENLLANLVATNPYRPYVPHGKEPQVAAIDTVNHIQSAPVASVGAVVDAHLISQLRQVNDALAAYDVRLQQVFDKLALSRSGQKPELHNLGLEYERLLTFVRQTEHRLHQTVDLIPETLPKDTGESMSDLMPEFSRSLVLFDGEFQRILHALQSELNQLETVSSTKK